MTSSLVRDRLTWMSYAQLGAWGYFFYGFGPVVPLLRDEQHTSRSVASLHGTAFALGGALTGLLLPVLVRRLGRPAVIWLGLAGVCASTAALLLSHHLPATLTSVMLASTSGGLVVNGIVAVLADHHGPGGAAAFSEANAVAAAVGLIAPVTVGVAVAAGYGWRPGLGVVIAVIVALAAVAMTFRVRAARAGSTPYGVAADPTPYAAAAGPLPRSYWLVWASIVATGSVEVCLNLWLADVLRSHAHVSPGGATAAVSAVVAGMCVGRLAGGRLTLRLAGTTVMLGALTLSAVGFTVFWLATAPLLALIGLVVTGLGNALHYPLAMSLAVEHSGGQPDLAAARTSYALGLSFGIAPFVLGAVADRIGPHLAFLLLPIFLLMSALAMTALRRRRWP